MNNETIVAESNVSGNRTTVPARIRRELDIDDGDRLRWTITEDGTIRVDIVRRHNGSFADFTGYDGDEETDVSTDHDTWGLE